MITVNNVLAATDLSAASRPAVQRAAQLCTEHRARLALLHVIEELPPAVILPAEQVVADARRELAAAQAQVPEDIVCEPLVETGKDFVAIIRAARRMPADLIAVGAHGHHLLRDYILGTTAEKLIRKSAIPVLVVRQEPRGPYRRLLVPTDFSEASRQALAVAAALAPGADLDLLHVYGFWGEGRLSLAGVGSDALERYRHETELWARTSMEEWLAGLDLAGRRVERHFVQGHAATTIAQFAAERQHDLVAMGTAGRTGLPYILLGSVTEHALRAIPCDTLTVRPAEFRFELP